MSTLTGGWRARMDGADAFVEVVLPVHLPSYFAEAALDESDVLLEREVHVEQPSTLILDGLGPIAEVRVDDAVVLSTRNLFRRYEVPLAAGTHRIALKLLSPARALREKRPRPKWKTRLVSHEQLRFLRAPLLGRIPSWASGHAARGVYRAPELVAADAPRAVALHAFVQDDRGVVAIALDVEATAVTLRVGELAVALERTDRWRARLEVPSPRRWWPHTHGEPARYAASLEIDGPDGLRRHELSPIGFRTVSAPDGNRFALDVNGVRIFCRGAVWVPRLEQNEDPRPLLEALRDAGGNMLRLGGTMRYEDEAFFRTCDELGLLVWQDFMLANLDYPIEDAAFRAELEHELDDQLGRLGAHASVAVLCGGSEVAQQAAMMSQPQERWYGPLFEDVLPARCRAALPEVPYVLGSPSSRLDADGSGEPAPLPFRPDRGVAHYYGVGAYLRPFDDARRADVTFASECLGISNVPEPESIDALFGDDVPATHVPRWKAGVPRDNAAGWDFEDVRDHYLRAIFGEDPAAIRYADTDRYLELSRITSAEIMTRTFSEWRRAGSTTTGGLVWFLRDLVPGAGWGLVDSEGKKKSPLEALRRVWSPTALLLTDEGSNGLRAHVVHDGPAPRALRLRVQLWRDGDVLVAEAARDVVAGKRSARAYDVDGLLGGFRDVAWSYRFGPRPYDVLLATLWDGDVLVGDAAHLLHIAPRDPGLVVEHVRASDSVTHVTIKTARTALWVVVRVSGWTASEGYFHLAPHDARRIELVGGPHAPRGFVHALGAAPVRLA